MCYGKWLQEHLCKNYNKMENLRTIKFTTAKNLIIQILLKTTQRKFVLRT